MTSSTRARYGNEWVEKLSQRQIEMLKEHESGDLQLIHLPEGVKARIRLVRNRLLKLRGGSMKRPRYSQISARGQRVLESLKENAPGRTEEGPVTIC